MPETIRPGLESAKLSRAGLYVSKTSQRVKRERIAIQVILQIENGWESSAGKFLLIPSSIFVLRFDQVFRREQRSRIIRSHSCQQADQTPGRLRSGAQSAPLPVRVAVGV